MIVVSSQSRVWHTRHCYFYSYRPSDRMIDLKALRTGLELTTQDLTAISVNSGVSRPRMYMAEKGLVTLKPDEESLLRTAINYALHCRSMKLLRKVGQGQFDNSEPMTWDEYKRKNHEKGMPKEMAVISVAIGLIESEGQLLLPLSEPIPWRVELNTEAAKALASFPEVLESMLSAIRSAVAQNRGRV
jgi:hypothetical protein